MGASNVRIPLGSRHRRVLALGFVLLTCALTAAGVDGDAASRAPQADPWRAEVLAGGVMGYDEFGSDVAHDFAWLKIRATRSLEASGLGPLPNCYVGPELNLGYQVYPEGAVLGGLSFALQYRWGTEASRWRPWVGGSLGPALTDVGLPDCSLAFLMLTQLGGGLEWRPQAAASGRFLVELMALHGSNADLKRPNGGINGLMLSLGWAWDW